MKMANSARRGLRPRNDEPGRHLELPWRSDLRRIVARDGARTGGNPTAVVIAWVDNHYANRRSGGEVPDAYRPGSLCGRAGTYYRSSGAWIRSV